MNLFSKYYFITLVVVISAICQQHCWAYRLASLTYNSERINPNMRCPGKNEGHIWHSCKYGGYIENPDPKNCGDRYVCYKGVNETCYRDDKCVDNSICTVCGVCQKCDNAESCSEFELCPNIYGFPTMDFIKRFVHNPYNELNIKSQ